MSCIIAIIDADPIWRSLGAGFDIFKRSKVTCSTSTAGLGTEMCADRGVIILLFINYKLLKIATRHFSVS